jgi:hypothetical protein
MTRRRDHRPDKRPPDVEIAANARARRLRFHRAPEAEVRFPGGSDVESDSSSERENLPDEVEPGVTYRDAKVRWRAESRIVEPEREPPPEGEK